MALVRVVHPAVLILLLLLVPLFLFLDKRFFRLYEEKRTVFAARSLIHHFWKPMAKWPHQLGHALWLAAMVLLCLALARPQGHPRLVHVRQPERVGYLVLDVSKSMKVNDADGSRLFRAKAVIKSFLAANPGDRLGLIAFEKSARQLCPATTDQEALRLALSRAYPGSLDDPGTDLEGGLLLALEKLTAWPKAQKYILLISDGETHGPRDWQQVSVAARNQKVRLICLGIGSLQGGEIPDGKTMWGKALFKTFKGKQVISKLESKPLNEAARLSEGRYFHWQQPLLVKRIMDYLELKTGGEEKTTILVYREWAFYLVLAALILLFLEPFVPKWIRRPA